MSVEHRPSPYRRFLAAIIVAALVLRIATALLLGDRADPVSGAYDQVSYDTLAMRLVQGFGYTFPVKWYPFTPPNEPTAHWSFLYTIYLALTYWLFGHHPLAARVIQVLLSALNSWIIYRTGRKLFGEWVGLAAAALTACYAYLVFFNAVLMTQTFYIIALLLAIYLAISIATDSGFATSWSPSFVNTSSTCRWSLLGVTIGVGILMRQTLLLFAPILLTYIWWASRSVQAGDGRSLSTVNRSLVKGTILSVAIIAAMVLPWTVRNFLVFHDFLLLNSNSGFWFYSSNHPSQGTSFDPNFVAPIPEQLQGLSEPAEDRALLSAGLEFIASDPTRFVLLSINRTKDYFWLVPSEQSSLLSNISRLLSFTLYLPFMLYGLWLSRQHWRHCMPLYLYVGFDAILCLTTWAAPRYRLPTDALMMVFAGLAVTTCAQRIGIPRWFAERFPVASQTSGIINLKS